MYFYNVHAIFTVEFRPEKIENVLNSVSMSGSMDAVSMASNQKSEKDLAIALQNMALEGKCYQ